MPSVNTWNGRWTGENNLYARVQHVSKPRAKEILDIGSFSYSFGDGWVANIRVTEVKGYEVEKIRRKTRGFYGYDWMIKSIINHLEIKTGD